MPGNGGGKRAPGESGSSPSNPVPLLCVWCLDCLPGSSTLFLSLGSFQLASVVRLACTRSCGGPEVLGAVQKSGLRDGLSLGPRGGSKGVRASGFDLAGNF
eukprot:1812482-Rhodomonas_salina.2